MKSLIIFTAFGALLIVVGAWVWFAGVYQPPAPAGSTGDAGGTVCTADAMQCPDGSWVGRTGPNCQFVCPSPTSTPSGGGGSILPYQSGIQGTITLGPTCPVQRTPPDPNCADKAYSTLVAIFRASDPVHAFVITQSDAQGHFKASLPPGDYVVGAGESNLPRCPQTPATVGPSGYTQVAIMCDTGIR